MQVTEWGPSTITKISPQKGPRPVPGGEVSHGDQGHRSPLPGSRRAPSPGPRLPLLDALYADCSAELDTRVTRNLEFNLRGKGLSCETEKDQANGSLRKEQTRERVLDCGRNRRDGSEVCSARCSASPGRICSGPGFQRTRAVRSGERSPRTAGPWLLGRWDSRAGSGGFPSRPRRGQGTRDRRRYQKS